VAGHRVPLRIYYTIFAALLVLTATTVYAAFFDLGPLNNVVAMTIAVAKALLVVLYFMHLRYSSRITWLFAGAGIAWLVILLALTVSDYISRGW
jgi:cytochrome c oxidase subunit 4